jgi:succinate-semialdehyde dehydrogenase/glutarate-semialdehyde dehydrogenase
MKLLIDGKKVDSSNGKIIEIIDPTSGKFLDSVPSASLDDMDQAMECSRNGFLKWKAIPLKEKEVIYNKFFNLLEEQKKEIVSIHALESGFTVRTCLFQFQGIKDIFSGYLESAKRLNGTVLVPGTETGHDGRTEKDLQLVLHEPLGTVLAIVPFNAPLMLFAYKVASALSAGNSVIVKPPSTNPLALIKITELLWEAGVPGDAIQLITGPGKLVGDYMVKDSRIHAVTLTGSTEVGIEIAETLAKRLAPCALELGGNDPFIVLEDADLELAAREGLNWRFNAAGQVCIAPKRFIIHQSLVRKFTEMAINKASSIEMGYDIDKRAEIEQYLNRDFNELKPGTMKMNCLISVDAAKTVETQVNQTLAEGAKLLIGGKRKGAFYEPTVLSNVTRDMSIAKDLEVFGPVVPIISFDTTEEAIEIANSSKYGLSGCVYTKDWQKGMEIARLIESGGVVVNGVGTYRNMMQPFGGYKMSGVGREGFSTLEELTQTKVIILKDFI